MLFSTYIDKDKNINVHQTHKLHFLSSRFVKLYSYTRSGLRIGISYVVREKKIAGSEHEIIKKIHEIRFNPDTNPYVITGGHFKQLFVRNLGIFYATLLDSRTAHSKKDWENRQRIALQTVSLDLAVFTKAQNQFTTIFPISQKTYSGINIYTYPSDSLYAILYTLCALLDENFISKTVEIPKVKLPFTLQTKQAASDLLEQHRNTLTTLLKEYQEKVSNKKTLLIKKNIHLSSARDGIKRSSSFYDNVIYWATMRLAKKLHLSSITDKELARIKKTSSQHFGTIKKEYLSMTYHKNL